MELESSEAKAVAAVVASSEAKAVAAVVAS